MPQRIIHSGWSRIKWSAHQALSGTGESADGTAQKVVGTALDVSGPKYWQMLAGRAAVVTFNVTFPEVPHSGATANRVRRVK